MSKTRRISIRPAMIESWAIGAGKAVLQFSVATENGTIIYDVSIAREHLKRIVADMEACRMTQLFPED